MALVMNTPAGEWLELYSNAGGKEEEVCSIEGKNIEDLEGKTDSSRHYEYLLH